MSSTSVLLFIMLIMVTLQIGSVLFFVHKTTLLDESLHNQQQQQQKQKRHRRSILEDETNVKVPKHTDGTPMTMEERLRYLELKFNSHTNFGTDPFFGASIQSECKNQTYLVELGCRPGFEGFDNSNYQNCQSLYDHVVCLDLLPEPRQDYNNPKTINTKDPPCLVYDFGIRAEPQFGAVMARVFGCEVHAFDPSPTSGKWWNSNASQGLRMFPNYHFHNYGAGGMDGHLKLHEYDWDQVSIMKFPTNYLDCKHGNADYCKMLNNEQKFFKIPVKTLSTIRKELGHTHRALDILKIDAEGSEYAFLENAFDNHGGCPDYIKQFTLEWHHMSWDERYGEDSNPHINSITTLLHTCGLKLFWKYGSWPSSSRAFDNFGMHNVRYDLASYKRD